MTGTQVESKPKIDREKLRPFVLAYIACALWSSSVCNESGIELYPIDTYFGLGDIHEDCLAQMIEDCEAFQELEAERLNFIYHGTIGYDEAKAGHDFWLSRNGHGAGFFDRGLGIQGQKLQESARIYGSVNLDVDDDSKVRCF